MEKDKIFTKEELLKVTELAEAHNNDVAAKHFKLTPHKFSELKKSQPELGEAYNKGVKARKRGIHLSGHVDKLAKPQKITEEVLNRSIREISTQEALNRFYEIKKRNDMIRIKEELKNIDL